MSMRKKIAILAGELEEEYPKLFLQGFLSKAFGVDYDVCVFAMYRRFQESQAREIGESSIYSLVDYKQFDAVVLMLDTIQTPGVAKKIEEDVRKYYSGPVLVVDAENDYFPYIEMNYTNSTKKLISHLIEQHGYKDIAYVTGWYGHKHAMQRLNAFRECMQEHGLPIKEDWVYYGDFWYNGGEQLVTKLVTEGKQMPRAIACANDYMAIGAAKMATKYGFRVPEDIAVIGYDMVEAGVNSPAPITSAPLSTEKYGSYAAECILALMEGKEMPEYVDEVELFIGSSCGCNNESVIPKIQLRQRWDTEMSARAFYAPNNHMNEDLLCQTNMYDLVKTIDYYSHQIRDFESFHICLNKDWSDYDRKDMEGRRDEVFSSGMLQVLRCASQEDAGEISFEHYFDRNRLLPELAEEHEKPRVYFFSPLHFEEKCFGYAAICYDRVQCYNSTYRMWLRNVMQAFECFRRIEAIQQSNQMLEASMIRDVLTGLYNYNGFLKKKEQLERQILRKNVNVGVLALDIKELMRINELYGRTEGDRTILLVARTLTEVLPEGLSVCFGNGEMVTIVVTMDDVSELLQKRYEKMYELLQKDKQTVGRTYDIEMYYGIESGNPANGEELERLVNVAVSKKNGNKVRERKLILGENFTEEELHEARIVEKILNENLFGYHFQPIIDAKNGEIFGYEALMRPDVNPYMAPPVVLKYAEYYDRLYDVERYTFFNVLDIVQNNKDIFDGSVKVFINSIPGNILRGEDAEKLAEIAKGIKDTVVVELTEQQEMTDEELASLKAYLSAIGFQTAVDDYGTGYANVTNLLRYMPNCVKIDRMLLSNIEDSPQKQHFVKDIITYSHDNNIIVLAEGIETKEELKMVIQLGVDLIQGYYTARPAQEIVKAISKSIKNEILEYNRIGNDYKGRQVYEVGKESHISLSRLAAEKYSIVQITGDGASNREVTLSGVLDMETDIYLRVKNGYSGKIILDNAAFQGKRHGASIDIGNDCDVTLVLRGENRCLNGGIRIPEDSRLTLEGEGHLFILVDGSNYFGIGNDFNARHGELVFEQSGCVEIKGNGMKGVGIGSGFGGPIRIHRGKYILRIVGQDGVGIGSYSGDVDPVLKDCDVHIDMATARAVGIGSIMGNVNMHLEYISFMGELNAEEAIAIGTFTGKKSEIGISHANVVAKIKAVKICGIGANNAVVSMYVDRSSVVIEGNGVQAIAWGNQQHSAKLRILASRMESCLHSALEANVGIKDENVSIERGEYHYIRNGENVILKVD